MARNDHTTQCSFCSKEEHAVAKLVQGPGEHAICDECVHLAAQVVADSDPVVTDGRQSCELVLEDGSAVEVAHGLHEAISKLGRDESTFIVFDTDDGRRAIRRSAVSHLREVADPES